MSERRYMLHPGPVTSADGDIHHVSARELLRLYRVRADECYVCPACQGRIGYVCDDRGVIGLWPDSSGRYELPNKEEPRDE